MRDCAVAPAIGVGILAAIVATMGAGAAVVLVHDTNEAPPAAVGFRTLTQPDAFHLALVEGDGIHTAGARLMLTVDAESIHIPLSTFELGPTWDKGERICLEGPTTGCADHIGAGRLTEVRISSADQYLWEWSGGWQAELATGSQASGGSGLQGGTGNPGSGGGGSGGASPSGGAAGGSSGAPSAPSSDLTVTLDSVMPTNPRHEEAATFTATVTNEGPRANPTSFAVNFYVDGAVVSSHALSPLQPGTTALVTSTTWTATEGDHIVTVVVDDDEEIAETDEANNAAGLDVTVGPPGTPDPGLAFEDAGNDGLFVNGLDVAIPTSSLLDGEYTVETDGYGLVIPASVGPITAEEIAFGSDDAGHLILGVGLTSTEGEIELEAGTQINATNLTLTAETTLQLSSQGDIDLTGTTLRAGTTIDPPGKNKVVICHLPPGNPDNGQTIEISVNALKTHEDHHDDYLGPCIHDDGILLDAGQAGHTIHVDGAAIDDADDTAIVVPDGTTIQGTPAEGEVALHDPTPTDH